MLLHHICRCNVIITINITMNTPESDVETVFLAEFFKRCDVKKMLRKEEHNKTVADIAAIDMSSKTFPYKSTY